MTVVSIRSIGALFCGEQYWCYTYRRFEDDVFYLKLWSCYSSDDWWRYWLTTLISSWWLSSQVEGWLSHRRQGEIISPTKRKQRHFALFEHFLSLLTVLLLLSWWLQTWMDGNINYGKEFAGMSRRQVRRCYRLHIGAVSGSRVLYPNFLLDSWKSHFRW